MTKFGISTDRSKALRRKMLLLKVYEKDIVEQFVRAAGPGGQNVNKVSTCVVLYHTPSGIQVRSQQERTQGMNRYRARVRLVAKIERQRERIRKQRIAKREKNRRRNRKRSKVSKEQMLENKKRHSRVKQSRRRVNFNKLDDY